MSILPDHATLGTGGWLNLTRQGLAPCKKHQALPGAPKLESQDDMQISTLRRIVNALGGELEIIAHMPTGDIRIRQFAG